MIPPLAQARSPPSTVAPPVRLMVPPSASSCPEVDWVTVTLLIERAAGGCGHDGVVGFGAVRQEDPLPEDVRADRAVVDEFGSMIPVPRTV